jgi:SecD/SecF fusion protein
MAGAGDFLLLAQAAVGQADPAPGQAKDAKETPATPAGESGKSSLEQTAEAQGASPERGRSKAEVSFRYSMSETALQFHIIEAAQQAGFDLQADRIPVKALDADGKKWSIELPVPPAQAERILQSLQADIASTPVFPSASKIGSKVAANMQQTAVMAMLLSFLGIVIYLWIRFQRVAYGLAAVIATLHDVLVTVAVLALTHWMAPILGFLLIENFKISLTVIAAFMTLIGYSINDKIVVFDRIRELRGKSPHIDLALVNEAVNQTLSRTILTGGTVLVSLVVIYIFAGQGIRAFSFTLLVGIIVGTWSSIYIGAPVLLWLAEGVKGVPESKPAGEKVTAASAEGR